MSKIKNGKAAPTWQEKLAELDVNNIYPNRTCEIILMAELTISFSEAIAFFNEAVLQMPTHVVKSINLEQILDDIKTGKLTPPPVQKEKGKPEPPNAIFQSAVGEIKELLELEEEIPSELLAQLIKLCVINKIFEDVTLREEERKLELQQKLAESEDAAGKKSKSDGDKSKKGSSVLPVEERRLYFILNKVYDPNLSFELYNIGMPLNAILELATPESVFREKYAAIIESSSTILSTLSDSIEIDDYNDNAGGDDEVIVYVNPRYEASKESLRVSNLIDEETEESEDSIYSGIYNKVESLYSFWEKTYKQLEGELQAKFLENTIHIRIFPSAAFHQTDDQPFRVFDEIYEKIIRASDAKSQHLYYLKNLRILDVEDEVEEDFDVESLTVYNKIISVVPSECFTVQLFMYCLIEEVCNRVENLKMRKVATEEEADDDGEEEELPEDNRLASDLINYARFFTPFCRTVIDYKQDRFNPKMHLKLSRDYFEVYSDDWLSFKINPYRKLVKDYLKINFDYLKQSSTTLLWRLFPRLSTIEAVYRNHQLQSWGRLLDLPVEKLKFVISAIEFDSINCQQLSLVNHEYKNDLLSLFPQKDYSKILKIGQPRVKYIRTPDLSATTLIDKEICLNVPEVPYSNRPSIYECKNIAAYLWYEKLAPLVLLQYLNKAASHFTCLDYKYSPYNDGILLHYHNNCDAFGINSRVWTQSLRSPICLRDFCKFIIHEDASWLDYEEELNEEESELKTLKDRCSNVGQPYRFYGYDVGDARVQVTGLTTTFHSLDGYKITVDTSTLLGMPQKLSLNLSFTNFNFILHYYKSRSNEPLTFHFLLADGTIIVYSKPARPMRPAISIAQRIKKMEQLKEKECLDRAYKSRKENVYYLTEKRYYRFKQIKVPFVKHKSIILKEEYLINLLERLCALKGNKTEETGIEGRPLSSKELIAKWSKNSTEILPLILTSDTKQNDVKLCSEKRKASTCDCCLKKSTMIQECQHMLKKIKKAKKVQIPMFKVFSSKLHKHEFIKRARSYIYIKIGEKMVRLLCKHPNFKITREFEIVKLFPLKLTNDIFNNLYNYDVRLSLSSSLLIHTVAGLNHGPFNIRQRYLDKGPQFRCIDHEESRTFLRSGNTVVKNRDGSLDIYSANGQIIHCEIPYFTEKTGIKYKLKNAKLIKNKYQSRLFRITNWRRRHIIDGAESRNFKLRRNYLRLQRLSNKIYILQENHFDGKLPFEFTLITHDGKKLKVTSSKVELKNEFFQSHHEDNHYEEYLRIRDDGAITFMFGGGILSTQFPDKTRISSWFSDGLEVNLKKGEGAISTSTFILDLDDFARDDWVFVQMFYKFEHPCYATVLFSKDDSECEIILPNKVCMTITEGSNTYIDFGNYVAAIITKDVVYIERRACETCMHRCVNTVNIKPLYDNINPIPENAELLRSCDSYEKTFIVNYKGKCFRNSNYIKTRINRANCVHHDQEDYQKLFILNRDLSGCKLWDVKKYRNRVFQASNNSNTVVQYYGKDSTKEDYTSLEFRTFKYLPYYAYFLNLKYCHNFTLSSHLVRSNPDSPICTSTCCIHRMPKYTTIELLKNHLNQCNQDHINFPRSDRQHIPCKCISQITRENSKIEKQSLHEQSLKVSVSSAISLCERWYARYENSQSYTYDGPLCECPSNAESEVLQKVHNLEERSEGSLDESTESHLEISKVCKLCNIPAHLECACKKKEGDGSQGRQFFTNEYEEAVSEYNAVAMEKIISIENLSRNSFYEQDLYVDKEEEFQATNVDKSYSESIIHTRQQVNKDKMQQPSPPHSLPISSVRQCKCNIQPRSSSGKIRICRRRFPKERNTSDSERQAGGLDITPNQWPSLKESKIATSLHIRYYLRLIKNKIINLVAATSNIIDPHQAKIYSNDIFDSVVRKFTNLTDCSKLLKRLNDFDMKKSQNAMSTDEIEKFVLTGEVPMTMTRVVDPIIKSDGKQHPAKNVTSRKNVKGFERIVKKDKVINPKADRKR